MNSTEKLIEEIEELRFLYSLGNINPAQFTHKLNLLLQIALNEHNQEIIDSYQNGWNDCFETLKKNKTLTT